MSTRFTVVIPSYLGDYAYAAKNRESKLVRAVDSCLNQTFTDFDIIVVADGCERSFDIVESNYSDVDKVDCLLIKKQPLWSGSPRNYGIKKATGEYIVYLDADDKLGERHLEIINNELIECSNLDWVWFNDLLMKKDGSHYERNILINERFQNGTSNICHKRNLAIQWSGKGYGFDDWGIVQQLHRYGKSKKIKTPQYFVCHNQQGLDV